MLLTLLHNVERDIYAFNFVTQCGKFLIVDLPMLEAF